MFYQVSFSNSVKAFSHTTVKNHIISLLHYDVITVKYEFKTNTQQRRILRGKS